MSRIVINAPCSRCVVTQQLQQVGTPAVSCNVHTVLYPWPTTHFALRLCTGSGSPSVRSSDRRAWRASSARKHRRAGCVSILLRLPR